MIWTLVQKDLHLQAMVMVSLWIGKDNMFKPFAKNLYRLKIFWIHYNNDVNIEERYPPVIYFKAYGNLYPAKSWSMT